jgi:glutathione S-transferase
MLHFYGSPMSSAGRSRWMLEELGIPYEYHLTKPREDTQSPAFLAINPGGTVPAIDDDGFRLSESIAINFYLAETYKPEWMGKDARERAQIFQWSLWAITNLQPEALSLMFAAMGGERAPSEAALEGARKRVPGLLRYLEQSLSGCEYLVGNRFSVADVNAGSVVNLTYHLGALDAAFPNAKTWMERLRSRPAFTRAAG